MKAEFHSNVSCCCPCSLRQASPTCPARPPPTRPPTQPSRSSERSLTPPLPLLPHPTSHQQTEMPSSESHPTSSPVPPPTAGDQSGATPPSDKARSTLSSRSKWPERRMRRWLFGLDLERREGQLLLFALA